MPYIGKKPADIIATAVDTTTGTFSGDLTVDTSTLYVDSANNRVGVGTAAPATPLEINTTSPIIRSTHSTSGDYLQLFHNGSGAYIDFSADPLIIRGASNAERARIDSSGNLLVGKTSADNGATVGAELNTNDTAYFTRSGGAGVNINRTSTDGNIAVLQKDGTTIGVLGVNGGNNLFISSAVANHGGLMFSDGGASTPQMNPISSGSTLVDNAMNIGSASYRFKDLYLTGKIEGVVQINHDDNTTSVTIAGGNDSNQGSNIAVYGPSHASLANVTRFRIGSTEKARIDSSGNLLVGTTDSSVFNNSGSGTGINLQNFGNIAVARDSNDCMALNRLNTDGDILVFNKNGTTVGSIGIANARPYMASNDSGLKFKNADITACTSTGADKDGSVSLGANGARFQNLYLSSGVYLGGTGSANKLHDYEEGTWTPTYTGGTTDPTVVYGFQVGFYTKIGKIVHIQGRLRTTSKSGGGGALRISGLPFTTISDSQSYSSINIPWAQGFASQTHPSSSYVYVNATSIQLLRFNGSDARSGRTTEVTTANMGTGTNDNDVMFAGTYMTND